MAVGKEAPIPSICVAAAARRDALEAAVAEFTDTLAAVPLPTVKKRLKNADIVVPFANGNVTAASNGSPSAAKIEGLLPKEGLGTKL